MKETAKFLSNQKDLQIVYDLYLPSSANRILVLVAHGMAEHRSRYASFCDNLCDQGFTVVIADHRGHGESILEISDHGDMGKHGFEAAVDDMHRLAKLMMKRFVGYKLVLFGHSMGSLLARRYMQVYGEEVKALVLSGTPSSTKGLGMGKFLASTIGLFRGEKFRSKLLNKLSFGNFNRSFEHRTGFEWLNSDAVGVDQYVADPACGFVFSVRSFYDLMDGIQTVNRKTPIKQPKCPILFVSGEKDPCGEFGVGVERTAKKLREWGYLNVSVTLYPNLRHEILQESKKDDVCTDIAIFLKRALLRDKVR